jgi:nucleotide-binding universal stress UspA family protein
MIALQTILCPVDFSPATTRQVDLAADLARAFRAKLVLHHNRASLGTGASVGWMWHADHQADGRESIEEKLSVLVARIPGGLDVETLMTEGPRSRAVVAVAEALDADLVVLTAHDTHEDDHVSVTEQMLERCSRPVFVLHEPEVEVRQPHFGSPTDARESVVVPTDLMPESRAAVRLALDLARDLPVDVHLLHLVSEGILAQDLGNAVDAATNTLEAFVPEDLKDRVTVHVGLGDPTDGILKAADLLDASCIIMGEHTRTPLRRWFSRDTARAILHQARCPVWYVPGTRAA